MLKLTGDVEIELSFLRAHPSEIVTTKRFSKAIIDIIQPQSDKVRDVLRGQLGGARWN